MKPHRSFKQANQRRCDLIRKKHGGEGLSAEEEQEFEMLQTWCGEWVDRRFPITTDKLNSLWQEARAILGDIKL